MTQRSELAARFRSDRDRWRSLVAKVDRARMDEPGPMGEWTFKDLVSHLCAWRLRTLARAEAALAERGTGCTEDERALLDALALGTEGRLLSAADRLDLALDRNPQALLLVKLSHTLRFMAGDVPGMLRTTQIMVS